jgi:CDP-glucose 4,6-dehydratase
LFDPKIYSGLRVLVTGHSGFKGSWLVTWLQRCGADVCGYSDSIPTQPSHWDILNLDARSEWGDLRNVNSIKSVVSQFKPEIIFHLAAQSLVRASYRDPLDTWSTNVLGTLNLFEAARKAGSVRAIINVTSDKCYENYEWDRGYHEEDRMGGFDPYSSSKGASELLTSSYRNSFFNSKSYGESHNTLLASCRAGNVIGGGDWAEDRLVPDIMLAANTGRTVTIRNPNATRPWQHVLEPLAGYLLVGQRLLDGQIDCACGWNFGPATDAELSVREVSRKLQTRWDKIEIKFASEDSAPHEAHRLQLDCRKAHEQLNWKPLWDCATTLDRTVDWYRSYYDEGRLRTEDDLQSYQAELSNLSLL